MITMITTMMTTVALPPTAPAVTLRDEESVFGLEPYDESVFKPRFP